MSSTKLIRWSGLALLVAGMLWLLSIFHPPFTLDGMLAPAWGPSHYVTAVASVFLVFGLIGPVRLSSGKSRLVGTDRFHPQ